MLKNKPLGKLSGKHWSVDSVLRIEGKQTSTAPEHRLQSLKKPPMIFGDGENLMWTETLAK